MRFTSHFSTHVTHHLTWQLSSAHLFHQYPDNGIASESELPSAPPNPAQSRMSLSFWSSANTAFTSASGERPPPDRPPPSTALNFLAASLSADMMFYSSEELNVVSVLERVQIAGSGGFSTIEVGRIDRMGKLVAVKRSLLPSRWSPTEAEVSTFEKQFSQLTLELRILAHKRLAAHPNVLDLLGICVDEYNEAPSLSLVLGYSPLGTLRAFLTSGNMGLSPIQHFDLISQAGRGLAAVHSLRVAHGDVKAENALVFSEDDGGWCVKISDFGQSLIASSHDPAGNVDPRFGTPLLNAPEIRTRRVFADRTFTIDAAMCADVFSFGLLAWEVLKAGKGFFDPSWAGLDGVTMDLSSAEQFLNDLGTNQLCRYGLEWLERTQSGTPTYPRLYQILEACLQDEPDRRQSMLRINEILDGESQSPG